MFLVDATMIWLLLRWKPISCSKINPIFASALALVCLNGSVIIWGLVLSTSAIQLEGVKSYDSEGKFVVLHPEKWDNKQVPILPFLNPALPVEQNEYTLVFLDSNCEKCEALLEELEQHADDQFVLIDIGKTTTAKHTQQQPTFRKNYVWSVLDPKIRWVVETPMVVKIRNGLVSSVQNKR